MGMTTTRYKGFKILARPYQLSESKRWTVDFEIRRHGRGQAFSAGERYATEREADAQCAGLGRGVIDGGVPGWSVDRLRGAPRGKWALLHFWKGESMRRLLIALLLILGLGYGLLRGANFASRPDVLNAGHVGGPADRQQLIPPWLSGAVMVVGVVLLVAGSRKRVRNAASKAHGQFDRGSQ
jgi:hypothetical protein